MNIMEINPESVTDGEGVRVVLYVSGCRIGCKGCHNPQSHDFNNGVPFTEDTMQELLDLLNKPYISGLTLSGGNPLEPENLSTVYNIIKRVRKKLPSKTIWLYTGLTFRKIQTLEDFYEEHEINSPSPFDIAKMCNVVVDGKYIDELRDITLPFAGSSNQKLIDMQETLKQGKVTQWKLNS